MYNNEIIKEFELSMKKGFTGVLVLLALEKGPTHGYNLKKIIQDKTFGTWNPSTASLYPTLKSLTEKGLIELSAEIKEERKKKIYKITPDGLKIIKKLIEKFQLISNAFFKIV